VLRRLIASSLAMVAGCSLARFEQRGRPAEPFDAVIVLGCPSRADGSPSRCQLARAVWAAILWERGWATAFITSGSDVHTPFVEAEALAQVMVALGVPADRIWLEREALHTDENVYYSLRIARALGFRTLGVASQGGHAQWACRMMADWAEGCRALPVDLDAVAQRARGLDLASLHARASSPWRSLAERERTGARRRPPSWILYPAMALMKARGEPWVPVVRSDRMELVTWADHVAAEMAASRVAPAPR